MMIKRESKPTAIALGGSVGGAVAWVVVLFMDLFSVELTPEQASGATAALSTIFGFAIRYLPEPKH